ncbi:MAG: capsule biosynthesis protein, partial [Geminicoccales bacterium]
MSGTARATIAITTLARYQTAFWLEVARRLESLGIEVLLIAFDDESADLIRAAGLPLLDMPDALRNRPELLLLSPEAQARVFAENGIDSIEPLLLHEWVTFELTDPAPLLTRLAAYLVAIGERLDEFGRQGKEVTLLQESGGFLSVLSAFHAARARAL